MIAAAAAAAAAAALKTVTEHFAKQSADARPTNTSFRHLQPSQKPLFKSTLVS